MLRYQLYFEFLISYVGLKPDFTSRWVFVDIRLQAKSAQKEYGKTLLTFVTSKKAGESRELAGEKNGQDTNAA